VPASKDDSSHTPASFPNEDRAETAARERIAGGLLSGSRIPVRGVDTVTVAAPWPCIASKPRPFLPNAAGGMPIPPNPGPHVAIYRGGPLLFPCYSIHLSAAAFLLRGLTASPCGTDRNSRRDLGSTLPAAGLHFQRPVAISSRSRAAIRGVVC